MVPPAPSSKQRESDPSDSVVSWRPSSGYKSPSGCRGDPGSTSSSTAPTTMKVLQHLLLPILLLMSPAPRASSAWNWNDRGHTPRSQPVPYMAYVQGRNQQSCGGFLVAPSWVMTAAQCLDYKPLTVILGAHTVQTRWGSQQRFEVQQYHRHPDFTNRRRGNDILLLKLKGNATINQHVSTISFNVDQVPPGTMCIVKGWSHTSPRVTLCEVWVTILKPRQCLNWNPWLAQNLICARNESFAWPKEGDAGDPLVCNNKAYGIFSYRHENWPGFYTHIAPFLTWINSVMKSA